MSAASTLSASKYGPPSVFTALVAMAALTFHRAVRGRLLWISMMFGALPVLYAVLMQRFGHDSAPAIASGITNIVFGALAVSASMNAASSVGEEIEERTMGYLWSRPLARWTIVGGKLLALVPMVVVVSIISVTVARTMSVGDLPDVREFLAFAAASTAYCIIAATLATLTPKHGLAVAISYTLFFDAVLGALPISIRQITISYHAKSMAGSTFDSETSGAIGVLIISCVWACACLARIRRIE